MAKPKPKASLSSVVLLATGDTLELAVFLSVKMQDEAAFERNYQQLQMYVSDTRYSIIEVLGGSVGSS